MCSRPGAPAGGDSSRNPEPLQGVIHPGPRLQPWSGGSIMLLARERGSFEERAMAFDRITCDPARMNGQACIRDLRLTVRRVVEAVAVYPDREELRREYPELADEDIRQALEYAAASLSDRTLPLQTAQ